MSSLVGLVFLEQHGNDDEGDVDDDVDDDDDDVKGDDDVDASSSEMWTTPICVSIHATAPHPSHLDRYLSSEKMS